MLCKWSSRGRQFFVKNRLRGKLSSHVSSYSLNVGYYLFLTTTSPLLDGFPLEWCICEARSMNHSAVPPTQETFFAIQNKDFWISVKQCTRCLHIFPSPKSRQDFISVKYYADSRWPTRHQQAGCAGSLATSLKLQIIVSCNKHHNVWNDHGCKNCVVCVM